MTETDYRPRFHALAVVTACATFPLIFVGGLVTTKGAGMAVPDWPTSFGYNMFALPWKYWQGGVILEHVHRLAATVVGLLCIGLAVVAWRVETRQWVRRLAYAVLGAVIFQGILGGLRVVMDKRDLAFIHGVVAQTFFCLTVFLVVVTSKAWLRAPDLSGDAPAGRTFVRRAASAVLVIYVQLILGAVMRHADAGLAIPDFPTSYGHWLPPTNAAELRNVLHHPRTDPATGSVTYPDAVTLKQVWLQFAHRAWALVVLHEVLTLAAAAFRGRRPSLLRRPALLLVALLAVQITLGILTVLLRKPADVASAHVAVGALTLVTAFALAVRAARVYGWRAGEESSATQELGAANVSTSPV